MEFRTLNANEIECRVAQVYEGKGITLLLYKTARTDSTILDETVGKENWQDRYYECKGNLFCSVGIKCGDEWIWKDDCGTESNTEKEKGEALTPDLIDEDVDLFIRYQMTDKKDKNINKKYLNLLISNLLKEEEIRSEPLKFLVFLEGKKEGIDVLHEDQLKAISQLSSYYKEKYSMTNSKTMNVRIDDIESFIEDK